MHSKHQAGCLYTSYQAFKQFSGLNTSILSDVGPVILLPKIEDNTKIHAAGVINR
jgi:hypothetical protein